MDIRNGVEVLNSPVVVSPDIDGGTIDDATINGGTTTPAIFGLPEKTPVNAVAASKVLTIGTNPVEGATVSIGGTTYKFRASIGAGVKAAQTLTFNSELPHDGDTVQLGLITSTYTFKTALTGDGSTGKEVLIEATVTATIDNLVNACMGGAGGGTKFSSDCPNLSGLITATKASADTFHVEYNTVGFLGNNFDTLGTLTHATWGNTTLLGGEDADAANDVLIGGDTETSIDNLVLAITAGAGEGTNYGTGTVANTLATAVKTTAATMTATNKIKGVVGNATALAETLADGSWAGGATFLSGGIDGTVGIANETCADGTYYYHTPVANTIADANWVKIPQAVDTDGTLAGNADTKVPSQKAVKTYVDALAGTINALLYKGVIDCSGNPNYPAADAGHIYVVSVAGKIGGAAGTVVVAGDIALCNTDSTVTGDQATVGAYWNIIEKNIDLTNVTITGGTINNTPIGATTPNLIYFKKGADIASATPDLSAATGNVIDITGNTTIASFGTVNAGALYWVRFTGALTLTYNATSLITPGARDILTSAGDRAVLQSLGSGNWLVREYLKASGLAIGMFDEQIIASSGAMTLSQCFGTRINNYGQANDATVTLPAAAKGMSFSVRLGTTVAKYYRLDPNASDSIYLDGVTTGDGKYIGVASAAAGNEVQFETFQTGAAAYDWQAVTVTGPWVAES